MKIYQILVRYIIVLSLLINFSCTKNVSPKTPEELLTASPWKIDELRYLQTNLPQYYKRGGSQNTVNFSEEYIEFFSDHTGQYHDQNLQSASFTWSFTNPEKTIIRYTFQYGLVVTWENIILSEKAIRYTEYYNRDGINSLAEGIRIPK